MAGYTFRIEGLEALEKVFKAFPDVTDKHLREAMSQSTLRVVAEVKPLAPVGVSGRLRNSIGSQITGTGAHITGHVGSTLTSEVYPAVMEYGRRPGRMPPPSALERWVHLVLGVPTEEAPGVAYTVARAIARRGIRGRFFLKQGFEASREAVVGFFRDAVERIVREVSSGG